MDKDRFKQLLVRDKVWLEELYSSPSSPNTKRLLTTASDKKLDTLIKFLHLLSNGEIKMHKKNFDSLGTKNVKLLHKTFQPKASIKRLISGERQDKLKKLNKVANVLSFLLYTLFN